MPPESSTVICSCCRAELETLWSGQIDRAAGGLLVSPYLRPVDTERHRAGQRRPPMLAGEPWPFQAPGSQRE